MWKTPSDVHFKAVILLDKWRKEKRKGNATYKKFLPALHSRFYK
jgi:hypothetical protein